MLCTTAVNTSNTIRTQTGAAERWSSGLDTNSCCYVITTAFNYRIQALRRPWPVVAASMQRASSNIWGTGDRPSPQPVSGFPEFTIPVFPWHLPTRMHFFIFPWRCCKFSRWLKYVSREIYYTPSGNLSLYVAKITYNEMSHISTYFPIITSEH